jgi:hypothetical protein
MRLGQAESAHGTASSVDRLVRRLAARPSPRRPRWPAFQRRALCYRRELIERLASDALNLIRERLDQLFDPFVVPSKTGHLLVSTGLAVTGFVHRAKAYWR